MLYHFSHRSYRLPFRMPLRTGHGVWTERTGVLLRLMDEQGRVGWGEVAPLPWFGSETMEEIEIICRGFGELVDAARFDAVPARFGCVQAGLAMARQNTTTPLPSTRVPVAALLPAGRAALAELPERLNAGYLAFKWKVGVGRWEEELPLLDDLFSLLPTYARLRLDANGAWDRRQATHWLEHCAERPIEFVEQPLPPTDDDGLLGLARDFPVTLALDESVAHLSAARMWRGRGWNGVFVLKPSLMGTFAETAAWIRETKADVVISSAIETAVGRAALLRWVLANGLTSRALGFGLGEPFGDRIWDGPATGPLLDAGWVNRVNPEAAWNALS